MALWVASEAAFVVCFGGGISARVASADDQTISIKNAPANPHFVFSEKDLALLNKSSGHDLKLYVKVPGKFTVPDSVIVDGDRKITVGGDGAFEIFVPVSGPRTIKTIRAVTPLGQVETQNLLITVEPWADVRAREVASLYKKGRVSSSLGITRVTFEQSNLTQKFEQTNLTLKLAYAYPLSTARWELGLNGFGTVFPIHSNTGQKAYYLGGNVRIGYVFPGVKDPWRVALHTGLYYTTVLSQNDAVGFKNFAGPQIFPTISYRITARETLGGYVKYAAVTNGFSLSFPGHEIAGGIGLTHALEHERALTFTLDISKLSATIVDVAGKSRDLKNTSATFSVGYAW